MICIKCKMEVPDGKFCIECGAKQERVRARRSRANGMGTAYKRGKTWTTYVMVGWKQGKDGAAVPVRRSKGGFSTKKEALEYCTLLKAQPQKAKDAGITFSNLYTRFIERHGERVTKDTLNCYKAAYKYYEPVYSLKMVDISTDDLQQCVDSCPRGKRTRENMKALGTLLFTYAMEKQIVTTNYAKFIWIPKLETESRNAFPSHIKEKILVAGLAGGNAAAIVACACYLGFRPTELTDIKKTDYDPQLKTLTGGIKTEAGMNRIVPIAAKIQPLIERLMNNPTEYIFTDRDKKYNERTFREACFYPCLERLGIQPIPVSGEKPVYSPYSCRHTFATSMKKVKGSQKDKAALMGHTSYEMTLKYQHEDIESMREIIDDI